jgi:hypothetical protein
MMVLSRSLMSNLRSLETLLLNHNQLNTLLLQVCHATTDVEL